MEFKIIDIQILKKCCSKKPPDACNIILRSIFMKKDLQISKFFDFYALKWLKLLKCSDHYLSTLKMAVKVRQAFRSNKCVEKS